MGRERKDERRKEGGGWVGKGRMKEGRREEGG